MPCSGLFKQHLFPNSFGQSLFYTGSYRYVIKFKGNDNLKSPIAAEQLFYTDCWELCLKGQTVSRGRDLTKSTLY